MHPKVRFNSRYLPALNAFRARQDVRYYLNSIFVCPHPHGGVYMVATNGEVALVVHDEDGYAESERIFRVSDEMVKAAGRRGQQKRLFTQPAYVELADEAAYLCNRMRDTELDIGVFDPEGEPHRINRTVLMAEFCDTIEYHKYPDINRLIPTEFEPSHMHLNAKYLDMVRKMFPVGSQFGAASIFTTGENGVLMACLPQHPEVLALIMPIRSGLQESEAPVPPWAQSLPPRDTTQNSEDQ